MKALLFAITLIAAQSSLMAQTADLNALKKEEAIIKLMDITGTLAIGEQFSQVMVEQMSMMLKQSRPDIPTRAFDILSEEVQAIIREEMESGKVEAMFIPIYEKYFTLEEIEGLLAFYETDIGRKSIEVLPQLTQESMAVGEVWGAGLGPKIGQRVQQRFAEEGIEIE